MVVRFEGVATVVHESGRTLEAVLDNIDHVVDDLLAQFERQP
jgi:hypothetical protein